MLEKRYSIGEVSELSGISTQTLRWWNDNGKFKADFKLPGVIENESSKNP